MLKTACVELITDLHVVGTVEHHIVHGNLLCQFSTRQLCIDCVELHMRIDAH
ncbi:hypothetical protein D3C81_2108970 [compost metagenome]